MDQTPVLVWVVVAMVVFWFLMIAALYNRLKTGHAEKYKEMGQPGLLKSSVKSGLASFRFLFRREHKKLGDTMLSFISDIMLAFLVVYMIFLVALFVRVIMNMYSIPQF